jgi:thiosulfate/3-mercaptopyruvate sulfurtransferase
MTNHIFLVTPVLIFASVLAQAQPAPSTHSSLRTEMVVSTDWLAGHLHDPDLVVVCITATPEFYSKGHIPGARNIALSDIAVTVDGVPNELPSTDQLQHAFEASGITNQSRVVLYSERYGLLAARAYFTLDYLGLADHTALLDGGIEKWKTEQRELSTDAPKITPSQVRIALNPSILVETAAMRELAQNKSSKIAIVDARPTDEFTGVKLSEDVSKAGHIPGASGLYWMKNIVSKESPVLRPAAELRSMYAQLAAGADPQFVTYCRTGMQSSFDYFVAKYLGYQVSMYDASFYDWSRQNLPAETSGAQK